MSLGIFLYEYYVSTGGPVTVVCDSAELDLTGVVPTAQIKGALVSADIDLTGVAPACRLAAQGVAAVMELYGAVPTGRVTALPASGETDLTAVPPTVSGNIVVTCDSAVLDLTGQSPAVRIAASLVSAVEQLIDDLAKASIVAVPNSAEEDLTANQPTIISNVVVTCSSAILELYAGAVTVIGAIFGLNAFRVPGEPRGWKVPGEGKGWKVPPEGKGFTF